MAGVEPVFRFHEQVLLDTGRNEMLVDRGLARVIDALWQLDIETQSCCEQDYAIIGEQLVASEHAYIGFAGTAPLLRFLEVLGQNVEDRDAFHTKLATAELAEPGRGRELETYEAYRLLAIGDCWSSANKLWTLSDDLILMTTYLAFPRRELSWIEALIVEAAKQRRGSP